MKTQRTFFLPPVKSFGVLKYKHHTVCLLREDSRKRRLFSLHFVLKHNNTSYDKSVLGRVSDSATAVKMSDFHYMIIMAKEYTLSLQKVVL